MKKTTLEKITIISAGIVWLLSLVCLLFNGYIFIHVVYNSVALVIIMGSAIIVLAGGFGIIICLMAYLFRGKE